MTLAIHEHARSDYAGRTYYNAHIAHITIAVALDYSTGGEKCTRKAAEAARKPFLELPIGDAPVANARLLYKALKTIGETFPIINVAGNGIYTLKDSFSQAEVNKYLLELLTPVHTHWPIGAIVSGGQTGVDLAGGVAGVKLGIPVVMTLPKGFRQRLVTGEDVCTSAIALSAAVELMASRLG